MWIVKLLIFIVWNSIFSFHVFMFWMKLPRNLDMLSKIIKIIKTFIEYTKELFEAIDINEVVNIIKIYF